MKYQFLNTNGDLAYGQIGEFLETLPRDTKIDLDTFFQENSIDCRIEDLNPALQFYQRLGNLKYDPESHVIYIRSKKVKPIVR